jgi:cell division protein FtsA
MIIAKSIEDSGFSDQLGAGIVLTGGGSLLRGCTELAESILGPPCRIGVPLELGEGLSDEIGSPEFATVSGLIKGVPGATSSDTWQETNKKRGKGKFSVSEIIKKIKEFFDEL